MSMTTVRSTRRTARAEYSTGDLAKSWYRFRRTAGAMARPNAAVAIVEIAPRRDIVADGRLQTADGSWDGGRQTAVCLGMGRMYAELHCHSTFSLLDGAAHPEQLVARAVQLGMPALALTDRDDLGGAVRFSTAAAGRGGGVRFSPAAATGGLKGIIGVELTIELKTEDRGPKTEDATPLVLGPRTSVFGLPSPDRSHIVLLAEDRAGYGNLSTLITRARLDHPRGVPRVTLETLARHAGGLFALTGSPRGWGGRGGPPAA